MLSKLALLVQSKIAVAVLGAVVIGGGGTAVAVAATGGHVPFISAATSSHDATETPKAGDNDSEHAHSEGIEGVLKGYDASAATISVQGEHDTKPTTIAVNSATKVNGSHANTLADLTKNIGSKVEVEATKQADGSLLALKVTVQGDGEGGGDANQANQLAGKVKSVDTANNSFQLQLADGSAKTVTVSAKTAFEGGLKDLASLTTGMTISVKGAAQADGTFAATSVQSETEGDTSGSGSSGSGSSQSGQQSVQIKGTVVSVSGASFVIKLSDGSTKTVLVTAQTEFQHGLTKLSDLMANAAVSARGAWSSDGSTFTATSVELDV